MANGNIGEEIANMVDKILAALNTILFTHLVPACQTLIPGSSGSVWSNTDFKLIMFLIVGIGIMVVSRNMRK